jgi:phage terminase small subunit
MAKNSNGLTPKQEKFCRCYVDTGIASEAYRMAYNTANMQPSTVWEQASRLLSDGKVAARIEAIIEEQAEQSRVDRQKVEQVLMDIVSADPSELYEVDEVTGKTRLKAPHRMNRRSRNALKEISNDRGKVSYKFNGKTEAAALLGKWNGWAAPTQVSVQTGDGVKGELKIGFGKDED